MTTPRRTLKALAALLPLGAFGISVALAAAPAKPIAPETDDTSAKPDVATRLAAVRTGVSQVIAGQEGLPPGRSQYRERLVGQLAPGVGQWRLAQWRLAQLGQWLAQWRLA